jgi:predicted RNase H-like HicB family nuclease
LSSISHDGVIAVKLRVVVHSAEEGGFWAEVPALPGCVSQGETLEETLDNIREAAEGWLEVADDRTNHDTDTQLVEIDL